MSIWKHETRSKRVNQSLLNSKKCIFCDLGQLRDLGEFEHWVEGRGYDFWSNLAATNAFSLYATGGKNTQIEACVNICDMCGWWKADGRRIIGFGGDSYVPVWRAGSVARLKQLKLSNIFTPLQELKDFLVAQYGRRYTVNPRLFELAVGDVFKAEGYNVEVTAYQKDDGIDVFLSKGPGSSRIGVQAKRWQNSITVAQIREFAGALYLNGAHCGIFVTTSKFTAAAVEQASVSALRGIPIELIDSQRLFDALSLQRTSPPKTIEEFVAVNGKFDLQPVGKELDEDLE